MDIDLKSFFESSDNTLKNITRKSKEVSSVNTVTNDAIQEEHSSDVQPYHPDDYTQIEEKGDDKLYPVYINLFSNNTPAGKFIKKMTGTPYSHATVALDASMNNMYSFSALPYTKGVLGGDVSIGRESLWSPWYTSCEFFTVLVTFVDKEGRDAVQKKIDNFIRNVDKFEYNTLGCIEYYFGVKNLKDHDETTKNKWFCSEFVAACINSAGVPGFENIYMSPDDLSKSPNVISLGKYTLDSFDEKDLIKKTKKAEAEFRKKRTLDMKLEYGPMNESVVDHIRRMKSDEVNTSNHDRCTAFVDWKKLYEEFRKVFPRTNPSLRFPLFELIIDKTVRPAKVTGDKVTSMIISELHKIRNAVKEGFIQLIDVVKSLVMFNNQGKDIALHYPDDTVVTEACKSVSDARKFVSEVKDIATKYDANFFIVTDGASGIHNNGNAAVRAARAAHEEWERSHGEDPDEDWAKVTTKTETVDPPHTEEPVNSMPEQTTSSEHSFLSNEDSDLDNLASMFEDAIAGLQNVYQTNESTNSGEHLYHLSETNLDGSTVTPKIPTNFLIKNGYEDSTTPRICFAPSIDKALTTMSQNLKGRDFYVHTPDGVVETKHPTAEEVPDVGVTGEIWVTKQVKLKCIGKIHVVSDDGKPGITYSYGDGKTAELYGWKWDWVNDEKTGTADESAGVMEFLPSVEPQREILTKDQAFENLETSYESLFEFKNEEANETLDVSTTPFAPKTLFITTESYHYPDIVHELVEDVLSDIESGNPDYADKKSLVWRMTGENVVPLAAIAEDLGFVQIESIDPTSEVTTYAMDISQYTPEKPSYMSEAARDVSNIFRADEEYIYLNVPYCEFYIPTEYFAMGKKFAEDFTDKINVIGLFNIGLFENDKLVDVKVFNVPVYLDINVYDFDVRMIDVGSGNTVECRVYKYYKDAIICRSFIPENSSVAQTFLQLIISGSMPGTIPYSQCLSVWRKNLELSGVSLGVSSAVMEMILAVMYRDAKDPSKKYCIRYGSSADSSEYDYMSASIRQICQYNSTFTGIIYEDIDSMITSAINRNRNGKEEGETPMEKIIKM